MRNPSFLFTFFLTAVLMMTPQTGQAQSAEQTIQRLTEENMTLKREISDLKTRIRFLESVAGSNSIRSNYQGTERTKTIDIEKVEERIKKTLTDMSTGAERYAKDNYGSYPVAMDLLTDAIVPYLKINYCGQTMAGFTFSCETSIFGYTFTATPVEKKTDGFSVISISTGGVLERD
ncbi:MAG: hypothetical protein AB7S78_02765 [Candidatus Omnitrophota bacterium]